MSPRDGDLYDTNPRDMLKKDILTTPYKDVERVSFSGESSENPGTDSLELIF